MIKLKFIILFFLIAFFQSAKSQLINEVLQSDYKVNTDILTSKLNYSGHTAMKPLLYTDVNFLDSTDEKSFKLHYSNFNSEKSFKIFASPLFGSSYTQDLAIDSNYFSMGVGARVDMNFKNKLFASFDYYSENASFPRYVGNSIFSNEIVPSYGKASPTEIGYSFSRFSGFVSFLPNKFFEFKAGIGKNFIGEGYRSLLLSDNAFQYPYLRINTTFWKLRYTNLFCMMDDIQTQTNFSGRNTKKFTTIHLLDWNISKRMNIGIFESVVWQSKDTLYNRGFDINYLNPIIFYRTVEYSLGSSDNSILGMNAKLRITDHYQLYAQFVLDEFLLKEVLDGRGWWANKYGIQFGVKAIEPFKLKGLFIQSEFNVVRPFTYSHGSAIQNYGHLNQPLAHPIGANFWESISIVRYQFKNFIISNQFNSALYGTDSSSVLSYGGNIYQSNRNRAQEYYNRIGQGISNHLIYNKFSFSWLIDKAINLRLELAHVYRHITTQFESNTEHFITLGIKTNLWNSYTDF